MIVLAQQAVGQGQSVEAIRQLEQAEARYRAAIELNPGVAAYHQSLARVLERLGREGEATHAHRRSIELDSLSSRNRAGYGGLLLRSGRAADAVGHLSAAARLDPTSVEVRTQLAAALRAANRNDEAVAVLRDARELAPEDSSIAQALAALSPGSPRTDGPHDFSDFEGDRQGSWVVRRVLRVAFATLLAAAAVPLVAPILGTLFLLLVRLPYDRLMRRSA